MRPNRKANKQTTKKMIKVREIPEMKVVNSKKIRHKPTTPYGSTVTMHWIFITKRDTSPVQVPGLFHTLNLPVFSSHAPHYSQSLLIYKFNFPHFTQIHTINLTSLDSHQLGNRLSNLKYGTQDRSYSVCLSCSSSSAAAFAHTKLSKIFTIPVSICPTTVSTSAFLASS